MRSRRHPWFRDAPIVHATFWRKSRSLWSNKEADSAIGGGLCGEEGPRNGPGLPSCGVCAVAIDWLTERGLGEWVVKSHGPVFVMVAAAFPYAPPSDPPVFSWSHNQMGEWIQAEAERQDRWRADAVFVSPRSYAALEASSIAYRITAVNAASGTITISSAHLAANAAAVEASPRPKSRRPAFIPTPRLDGRR